MDLSTANIKVILLDIEGTTTSIAFVYDVLFPFARKYLSKYLTEHSSELEADFTQLREEHAADVAQDLEPPLLSGAKADEINSLTTYALWLMDRDRKSTALKSIQGKIWDQGYRDGILKSGVFEDVAPALIRWRQAGMKIAIFSSGSVLAQKLLFAHSNQGDLTKYLDNYFDTTTGPKKAPESYRDIASVMDCAASETLFISDVTGELDAAAAAGMHTLLCVRPGNHPQVEVDKYQTIQSFDELG